MASSNNSISINPSKRLSAIMSLALLLLCSTFGAKAADPTWTIMVYGDADNNLSPQLVEDIMKMERSGSSPQFRIVVEADFDASNAEENEDSGLPEGLSAGTTRFLAEKSKDEEHLISKPVMRLRELNHDDPEVLKDFLVWAMKKHPADRYGVIFWDHGGQWCGFGGDEQDGTLDYADGMSTEKIRGALSGALRDASVKNFDFIAFDTCLMGGMEVLEDFDGLSEVFIACPEIDYGDGWNYGETLEWLKRNPSATMRDFALQESKLWKKLHMSEDNECDRVLAAHCAYNMAKYAKLKASFKDFAAVLSKEIAPDNLAIPKQRRKTVEYSLSLGDDDSASDFIDLGQFARAFADSPSASPELKQKAKALADAIDETVIAKVLGEEKFAASGLSIWYPVKQESDGDDDEDSAEEAEKEAKTKFKEYKGLNLFKNSSWADYIQKVWKCRDDFDDDPVLSEPDVAKISASSAQGLNLPVQVESGKGAFMLHGALVDNSKSKGKNDFVYLGQVLCSEIDGPGSYKLSWNMKALSVLDARGSHAFLGAFPKDVSGRLWVSYAQYKKSKNAKPFNVILLIQVKDGAAKLLKMLDANSEDLAPAPIAPRPGSTISPFYVLEKRKGKDPDKWKQSLFPSGVSLVVPAEGLAGMKVEMAPLPPGDYALEMQVEDINGSVSNIVAHDLKVTP